MRSSILLLLSGAICYSASGQGYVSFVNISSAAGVNAPVYLGDTKVTFPYVAQLLGGPDSTSLAYLGAPAPFLSGAGAGYFNGGTVVIPGVPGGGTAHVQVVVWDPTLGGTTNGASAAQAFAYWAAGHSYGWGSSPVFTAITGDPTASPPMPPPVLSNLTGLSLAASAVTLTFPRSPPSRKARRLLLGNRSRSRWRPMLFRHLFTNGFLMAPRFPALLRYPAKFPMHKPPTQAIIGLS